MFDSTIPYDVRFFETLDRFVQREPWLKRDKAMIDQLKTIGIEKGKPFNPDAKTRRSWTTPRAKRMPGSICKYEGVFSPPFNEGTHWALPASPEVAEGMQTNFAKPERLSRRRPRRRRTPWRTSAPSTSARASTT